MLISFLAEFPEELVNDLKRMVVRGDDPGGTEDDIELFELNDWFMIIAALLHHRDREDEEEMSAEDIKLGMPYLRNEFIENQRVNREFVAKFRDVFSRWHLNVVPCDVAASKCANHRAIPFLSRCGSSLCSVS